MFFIAWLVYTTNIYSNTKYYENICNCLRVIQQDKNRKLKSANCWQQTSLIRPMLQQRPNYTNVIMRQYLALQTVYNTFQVKCIAYSVLKFFTNTVVSSLMTKLLFTIFAENIVIVGSLTSFVRRNYCMDSKILSYIVVG